MTVGREASKLMKELSAKFDVTEKMILFCNDRVKDGQKFVTIEGFKEDKVDSVLLNMMTFVLFCVPPFIFNPVILYTIY